MCDIKPKIKLIAIDLDGTLLTSQRQVHPKVKAAVAQATKEGITVCLASGRTLNTMLPFATELGLGGPIVSCNGAYVLNSKLEAISHKTLDQEVKACVMEYAREENLHTNVYVGAEVYFSTDGEWAELYRQRTGAKENSILSLNELEKLDPLKILYIDSAPAILKHRDHLSNLLDPRKTTIVLSEAEYIEFLPPIINKAEGLKAVANVLNIDRNECAAIGDYYNDLEMVEWVGFGGAVSTAIDEVKLAAELIVPSNDEGGVAEFIYAVIARND